MSATPRVVSYVRMSTDKQEDSPERQRAQIVGYAKTRGYTLGAEYSDMGIAGDDADRPGFRRLLSDATSKKFDIIIIDEPSRLSRTKASKFIALVAYPLEEAGVSVEAVSTGPVGWDDLGGLIQTVVHADRSNAEVKTMSRRVLDGMAREARAASWNGIPPFGYKKEKLANKRNRLIPGEELHIKAVKWLFAEYSSGRLSLAGIAAELAKRGIVSGKRRGDKAGQPFTPQGIASILRNRAYVGDFTWNKENVGKYSKLVSGKAQLQSKFKRGRTQKADWIVIPETHEPLIDRDTFQAVAERLKTNRRRTTPLPEGGGFKLSKLLACGKCGSWMSGFTHKSGAKKYRCGKYYQYGRAGCDSNTVNESSLVRVIGRKLQEEVLNATNLANLRETVRRQEQVQNDPGTRTSLEKRLAELNRKIDNGNSRILELPADRVPGAVDALRRIEAERDGVSAELAKIVAQVKPTKHLEQAIEDISNHLWKLREELETGQPGDVRAALENMVIRVVVNFERKEVGKIVRTKARGGFIYTRPFGQTSSLETMADNT